MPRRVDLKQKIGASARNGSPKNIFRSFLETSNLCIIKVRAFSKF
jgi:hypothetical protein